MLNAERLRKNKTGAYAHSRPDRSCDEWQSLSEHLENTADQAEAFAASFGGASWARLAGLWHDLGKYAPDWQEFLRSAGEDESHRVHGPDHSTAGAIHSLDRFGGPSRILAYLIAGHHAGLADWLSAEDGNRALSQRLLHRDHLGRAFAGAPPAALLDASSPADGPPSRGRTGAISGPGLALAALRILHERQDGVGRVNVGERDSPRDSGEVPVRGFA
jgi:CRISPR-associated endonuclease/helicase Cas3